MHKPVKLAEATASLIAAVNSAHGGYSTNFTAALEMAKSCFLGKHIPTYNNGCKSLSQMIKGFFFEQQDHSDLRAELHNKGNILRRIIMLTDGDHNCSGCPVDVARDLKKSGVIIDCIGIGGSPKDVNEELLKEIASRNPDGSVRYCFIGDQAQLLRKYESLAHHLRAV